MRICTECERINSAGELYCLTCGSAHLEDVGDELPFVPNDVVIEGSEFRLYVDGQHIADGESALFIPSPDEPEDN